MWRLRCTETTHKYLLQECVAFKERSAKEYNSISTHSHNSYCIYMHTNKHIFVKVGEHFYTYTVTHRGTPCTEHYFPSQSCGFYFVCRSPLCSSLPATFLQAGGLSDTSVPLCNQKKKKKLKQSCAYYLLQHSCTAVVPRRSCSIMTRVRSWFSATQMTRYTKEGGAKAHTYAHTLYQFGSCSH